MKFFNVCFFLILLVVAAFLVLGPRPLALAKSRAIAAKTPSAWFVHTPAPPSSTKPLNSSTPKILEGYAGLPLRFEANQGQSDPRVKFVSRGSGYSLFLTSTETVLTLRQVRATDNRLSPKISARRAAPGRLGGMNQRFQHVRSDRGKEAIVRMRLVGANSAASPVGVEKLPGTLNYFLGSDRKKWRTDVPTFAKVRYEKVYAGVDLIYHGDHRQLEYDFVVAPGATPDVIRMSFRGLNGEQGASVPDVNSEGNLMLHTSGGDVGMGLPFVYQQTGDARQQVSCHYAFLGKDQVGFSVGRYDHSKPLIIDPVLVYSTYLGGNDEDTTAGIAVDASGSAYLVGSTLSYDFPTTPGTLQENLAGQSDVFVTKLSADGKSLIYSTYLGGKREDSGNGIAVDSMGNAYITGATNSNDFPITSGAFQALNKNANGDPTAFVAKIAPDGQSLAYSTYLGGSGTVTYANGGDSGNSIAIDPAGSAYVTGITNSTDFPTTPGVFQTSNFPVSGDAFVTKLAPDGKSLVYSTYLGGDGDDVAFGIAVDSALNAYVTGKTTSSDFPTTPGVFQSALTSAQNAFVSKLAPDGKSLVYSTLFGGMGSFSSGDFDLGTSIAVDSTFNAYVTGFTNSATFPTKNAFQGTYGGGPEDGFLAKFNPTGSALLYSTYLGGTGDDGGWGVALDSSGNANLTGVAGSSNFPIVNAVQSVCGDCQEGGQDAFVAKFDTTQSGANSLLFSSFLGGTTPDYGSSIAIDGLDNVYVTGPTDSGFPITPGAVQVTPGDSCLNDTCDPVIDGFVAKIAPNSAPAFTLTQARLDFGNLSIATSASLTAIVGNAGTAALSLSGITLTGTNSGEFSESDTCSASIGAGGSCQVTVQFLPVTTGAKTAVITFTFGAASGSRAMDLLGVGVIPAPALTLAPTSYDFGNIVVGSTSITPSIQMTNTGNVPVTISSVSLTGTNSGDFVVDLGSLVTPLRPGDIGFVRPTFEPTAVGNRTATITITDTASATQNNDPGSPHILTLTGVGVPAPDFTVSASPSTATVTAGQSTSYAVTLAPVGGFTGTVFLACTGAPNLASCTAPASISLNGTNPVTTTVTVTTTAHSIVIPPQSVRRIWPNIGFRLWCLFALLFLTMAVLANKAASRVTQRLAQFGFAVVFLFAVLFAAGCGTSSGEGGGGGGNPGTPAGSYSLTFTGTSGTLSHNTSSTLTVN